MRIPALAAVFAIAGLAAAHANPTIATSAQTTADAALAGSAANIVTNGTFSASSYSSNNQFGTVYGGQGVTGWTGNGGYDIYFFSGTDTTTSANTQYGGSSEKLWGTSSHAISGNFVALDGDPSVEGGISQTVTTVIGTVYQLTFDFGAGQVQSRTGATTEQIEASLGSQSDLTAVISNPSQSFTGWFSETFDFTATSTSELLSFLSIGTPTGQPPIATLDNVSLVAVPEPVSMSLLGAGLVGLGIVRRRRAARKA